MTFKITVYDYENGKSYQRDMTAEEIAQAEIDEQLPKQWQTDVVAN